MPYPLRVFHKILKVRDWLALRFAVSNPLGTGGEALLLRTARLAVFAILILFPLVTLFRITWDVPFQMGDVGDLYTDEGFYSADAVTWYLEGKFFIEREFNLYIAMPMVQWIQAACFYLFGFGLLTLRLMNWAFFVGVMGMAFLIMRRFVEPMWALAGVAFIASNHVVYSMSRYALAEGPMAFFVTAAVACAVHSRGRWAYPLAAASALLFALGVMSKTNAFVVAPVLAVTMIAVEWNWRRILAKFLLCCAVFFTVIGLYYHLLIRPNLETYLYFFTLNVKDSSPLDFARVVDRLPLVFRLFSFADVVLVPLVPVMGILAMLSHHGRRNPLLWLSLGWLASYLYFYSFYGVVYPRFFVLAMPGLAGVVVVAMRTAWEERHRFSYLLLAGLLAVVLSATLNIWRVGGYMVNMANTYNEMTDHIKAVMDADPDSNNVVMGHHSAAVALRTGAFPRNDRHSPVPFRDRVRHFEPSYYVSENIMRLVPLENYYMHREWLKRYYEMELIARYNILNNYRGYPVAFYKLHPREEEWNEVHETP